MTITMTGMHLYLSIYQSHESNKCILRPKYHNLQQIYHVVPTAYIIKHITVNLSKILIYWSRITKKYLINKFLISI